LVSDLNTKYAVDRYKGVTLEELTRMYNGRTTRDALKGMLDALVNKNELYITEESEGDEANDTQIFYTSKIAI
jgi:hypothetical protein